MKPSPQWIKTLKDNEVFVFGSNESGIHGAGAAYQAMQFGAVYGKAEGPQGRTYAIPTKDKDINHSLPLQKISKYVKNFIAYAKKNSEKIFLVTEIGCGLSNFKPAEIAPLFHEATQLENVHLPKRFIEVKLSLTNNQFKKYKQV
jgi:hypothetical protein